MKSYLTSFLLFLFVGFVPTVQAQQNFKAVKQHVQELISENYLLNVSVAYIQPDGEVQYFSFGKISSDKNKKPGRNTIYEIGSITKTFTSLILARMVEEGIVSLDTPIGAILPDTLSLPSYRGQKITLLNLATHTSGLPRMPSNFSPAERLNPYADYSIRQLYEFLDNHELTRATGSEVAYSNLGVGLLGHLLVLKSGMPYEHLLNKYITKPLKMKDTQINISKSEFYRFAAPYNYGQKVKRWNWLTLAGAGAIRSTTKDLVTYLKAQTGLVKTSFDSAIALTHQIQFNIDSTSAIGLAWFRSAKHDTIIWHNGGTGGYRSFIGWNTEKGTGVVILASGTKGVTDIGLHILDKRFNLNGIQETVDVDSTTLSTYIGSYQITPFFGIEIFMKDGNLMAQATGQSAFRIFPESEARFFLKTVKAEIEFIKNDEGKVIKLKLYQGGRVLTGVRGGKEERK